jgi:hypothetical protein
MPLVERWNLTRVFIALALGSRARGTNRPARGNGGRRPALGSVSPSVFRRSLPVRLLPVRPAGPSPLRADGSAARKHLLRWVVLGLAQPQIATLAIRELK